jgi:hypothetical protein
MKTEPKICKYLVHPSNIVKDKTGEGNDYIDTYYFCTLLKKRIIKKHCAGCKNFEKLKYPI